MTVYDASTMDCDAARRIGRLAENGSVMQQIARAKVSFCVASANNEGALSVGYFDAVERHYEFRALDVNDAEATQQLCVDLALAADLNHAMPTNYRFATEFGEFSCEQLPIELLERGAVPMVAPSHVAIHIDVDPVLVHASGANRSSGACLSTSTMTSANGLPNWSRTTNPKTIGAYVIDRAAGASMIA